jgi:hypothetical protein
MGSIRFGIPQEQVLWLKDQFGLRHFVETGTNTAESSVWASRHFDKVLTIEGFEPLHRQAKNQYGQIKNIEFVLGESPAYMRALLPTLETPALFWLDAHWCGPQTYGLSRECPVLDELGALNRSDVEHFILIDDARLFLAPPPLPHKAAHWPGIREISECVAKHRSNRYVAVYEDVIYCVPGHAREKMVEHLQLLASDAAGSTAVDSRLLSRVRRRLASLRSVLQRS